MNSRQQNIDPESLRSTQSIQLRQFQSEVSPSTAIKSSVEEQVLITGVEASQRWPKSRMARLAKLRSRIEAGTYAVKSEELAACMVKNDTHFSSVEAH